MKTRIPRPPTNPNGAPQAGAAPSQDGYGRRSLWPLPAVGESARRDPHIPDPVQNAGQPISQRDISPPVSAKHWSGKPMHAGDGAEYNGLYAAIIYIKRLGNHMTRSLGRNYMQAAYESRWRVGGVSLPMSYGPPGDWGPGYHGDAETAWPNNPQTYLRNPGIKPLTQAPYTYRIAPNMVIQPVGPTIGDVGNSIPIGH